MTFRHRGKGIHRMESLGRTGMSEKAERASMVERVARALCRLWLESDGESYEPEYLARCIDESWHQYVTEARAAI